jgi:hypothetical protein
VKVIYKYLLRTVDEQIVLMPPGAEILSVATQNNVPCIWALVEPGGGSVPHRFGIYGTGHPLPEDLGEFVGTFFMFDKTLVFHVFDQGVA